MGAAISGLREHVARTGGQCPGLRDPSTGRGRAPARHAPPRPVPLALQPRRHRQRPRRCPCRRRGPAQQPGVARHVRAPCWSRPLAPQPTRDRIARRRSRSRAAACSASKHADLRGGRIRLAASLDGIDPGKRRPTRTRSPSRTDNSTTLPMTLEPTSANRVATNLPRCRDERTEDVAPCGGANVDADSIGFTSADEAPP